MGLEASDDPDFGKPTYGEQRRAEAKKRAVDDLSALLAPPGYTSAGVDRHIRPIVESIVSDIIYAVNTR